MQRSLVLFVLLLGSLFPLVAHAQLDAVDISFDEQAVTDLGYPLVDCA